MEILINGEIVDHTLSGEENIAQVLQQLEQWATGQGATIVDVYLNEQPIEKKLTAWPELLLSEVWKVELRLLDDEVSLQQQLQLLDSFCGKFSTALEQGEAEQYFEEWPQIEKSVGRMLPSFSLQPLRQFLSEWQKTGKVELLAEELNSISRQFQNFYLLLTNELAYWQMLVENLRLIDRKLQTVGSLFHHDGRESLLTLVKQLLEWLSDVERLARQQPACLRYYKQVHPALEQLEKAMVAGDWLLVGDVLEYELQPRLDHLRQYLLQLLESGLQEEEDETTNLAG